MSEGGGCIEYGRPYGDSTGARDRGEDHAVLPVMRASSALLALAALAAAASCTNSLVAFSLSDGEMRAINASSVPVTLTIDGRAVVSSLPVSGVSDAISLSPGTHTIA